MTPETQALVDRLLAIHRRGIKLFGEGMLADDLRNAQSAPDRVCERWVEEARGDARIGLDVLAIRDAAAALSTLSRDLAAARACPDCQQPLACPAGTAERIAGLEAMHEETLTRAERAEADLAVARQERAEAQRGEQAWVEIAAQDARDAADRLTAAVRAARAETWAAAADIAKEWLIADMQLLSDRFTERAAREEQ